MFMLMLAQDTLIAPNQNSEYELSLFSAIVVYVIHSLSCHVASRDFKDQVIAGQETKAKSSHFPVDLDENLQ